jgi:hypothetical protein
MEVWLNYYGCLMELSCATLGYGICPSVQTWSQQRWQVCRCSLSSHLPTLGCQLTTDVSIHSRTAAHEHRDHALQALLLRHAPCVLIMCPRCAMRCTCGVRQDGPAVCDGSAISANACTSSASAKPCRTSRSCYAVGPSSSSSHCGWHWCLQSLL